jgi:hypothetical protein
MMNYANGGLHNLAHHVRGKGRGKDSMLVHMTPREVQGLQALAKAKGGTLTINPETGLPEAGFLEDILPVVAMAAATYFTAGAAAPALSAALGSSMAGGAAAGALAGAGVGGIGAAVQGKDVGKGALYGGIGGAISGGMGAYDGAASADLFSGATSTTPSPDVVNKVALDTSVTGTIPGQSGSALTPVQQAAMDPTAGLAGTTPGMPTPPPNPGFTPVRPDAAAQGITGVGPDLTSGTVASSAPPVSPSSAANASRIVNSPATYYSKLGSGIGDTATKGFIQAAPGIGADIGMNENAGIGVPGAQPYVNQSLLDPDFQGYTPAQPDPYYRAQYTRYAAGGGLMDLRSFDDENGVDMSSGGSTRKKKRASLTADRTINSLDPYNAAIAQLNNARYGANMSGINALNPNMTSLGELPVIAGAKGGIASLGGYSDGGRMLKGPGDGMSDSIPGVIGSKQPARLADGEFVVPADVVSHLGNGSTDAGARKLYAMMDKVRRARTGKKKQAPAVKTSRYMPA